MIETRHTFTVAGECPVDGRADLYHVTVETTELLPVEGVVAKANQILATPMFQEDFTERLSDSLAGARVMTTCIHSNVETVCRTR